MSRSKRLCIALVYLAPVLLHAQESPRAKLAPQKAAAVDKAVEAQIEQQGLVGVAIGIIRNGEVVYVKGYGQADREKKSPVTTRTVFNWASNSKPLAAVAAMQLVAKKQLDLEADVRQYVPEFPDKGVKITVRHVLCHQSGIPHYSNGQIIVTKKNYTVALPFADPVVALDTFKDSPLIFPPGEKTSYSSYAYILLSAVVQRAGKQPFAAQIEERIAKPIGMKSLQQDFAADDQKHWSIGYTKGKDGRVVPAKEDANYWKHGAGGFKSDVRDFATWALALSNRRVLAEAEEQIMWKPQSTIKGEKTTYGLGVIVEDQGGLKVSHNGKQDETTTRLVIYPRSRQGVVVMCNCSYGDPAAISTAIFAALGK